MLVLTNDWTHWAFAGLLLLVALAAIGFAICCWWIGRHNEEADKALLPQDRAVTVIEAVGFPEAPFDVMIGGDKFTVTSVKRREPFDLLDWELRPDWGLV